ncbi:MAG TPA: hypothetical protein VGE74_18015 [Gemmata sp.]
MESWRLYWRKALAAVLPTTGIESLRDALRSDNPCLVQGSTTVPAPLIATRDERVCGACAIAFCGWQGDALETVGAVEEFFSRICWEGDQAFGEPAGCRKFLDWFDDTPRDEVRRELFAEVERTLAERSVAHVAA